MHLKRPSDRLLTWGTMMQIRLALIHIWYDSGWTFFKQNRMLLAVKISRSRRRNCDLLRTLNRRSEKRPGSPPCADPLHLECVLLVHSVCPFFCSLVRESVSWSAYTWLWGPWGFSLLSLWGIVCPGCWILCRVNSRACPDTLGGRKKRFLSRLH